MSERVGPHGHAENIRQPERRRDIQPPIRLKPDAHGLDGRGVIVSAPRLCVPGECNTNWPNG